MRECMKRALLLAVLLLLTTVRVIMASQSTERVYELYGKRVVQVEIMDASSGAKSGIGSGFIASPEGHIITNYHVISQMINRPGRYRAEYVREDDFKGDLAILEVDVIHDLALLKAEELSGDFLALEKKDAAKGETLFSMGYPYDMGLTIVEGTFNGYLESLYEKIHFTGSVNPGMSGGPVLNKAGRVVGINVATAGNQVSFLVPVKYAAALISGAAGKARDEENLSKQIGFQLLKNQDSYMKALLEKPLETMEVENYLLPGEIGVYVDCWGDTLKEEDILYERVKRSCSSTDEIYLSPGQRTGTISFEHKIFRTDRLDPFRFYKLLEGSFGTPQLGLSGGKDDVGNYSCRSDFVKQDKMDYKVIFCLRGYKKLQGLYDAFMTFITLLEKDEALHSTVVLSGVNYENALEFSRAFLKSVSWEK